jgi:[ribosomal protein S18]-alanine N-acetyltransferase
VSTTVSVRLRPATAADIDAIARIESLAFTDPWSRASFASLLGSPHVVFLVAEHSTAPSFGDGPGARGEVAGYVVAWAAADQAEIANIAIAPSLRGRGFGGRLLDAAIHDVEQRGATAVFLEVRESNAAARALYAARRFAEVGRRRAYYRRPVEDALVLRRDAHPE